MIELQGITLTYRSSQGPVDALRGIDLRVARGEIFGVIGKSGAGKSSLVRVVNLLTRPTTGRVEVDGVDLTALREPELRAARQRIGMIFQHFNLLSSRTVYGNVALPLELAGLSAARIRERVLPLLELVGLAALADRYPAQISGGQKQRVGIARALANRPTVLLSDEATSALDPETTRSILALLRQINREMGLTIVLITHQMQVVKQVADRVAVIDSGRIVEQGRVLDVFSQPREAITRSLIDEIVPQALPAGVLAHVQAHRAAAQAAGHAPGRLLRLSCAGQAALQPIFSQVALGHRVQMALLHGQLDEVAGEAFGSFAVLATGEPADIEAAIATLRSCEVRIADLQSPGAVRAPFDVEEA